MADDDNGSLLSVIAVVPGAVQVGVVIGFGTERAVKVWGLRGSCPGLRTAA